MAARSDARSELGPLAETWANDNFRPAKPTRRSRVAHSSRWSVATVDLYFHPRDSDWRDRIVARLRGVADVRLQPLPVADRSLPEAMRSSLTLLVVSAAALAAGLELVAANARAAGIEILPLLLETVEGRIDGAESDAWLPTQTLESWPLAGRPLVDGSQAEVEAFFTRLRYELAQRLPKAPAATGADLDPATEKAFSHLFRRHYPWLVRFFGSRCDAELARDLAQETMIRALQGLPKLEGEPTGAWIKTIAVNVWRNWLRDEYTTQKRSGDEEPLDERSRGVPEQGGLWPTGSRDPELRVEWRERRAHLQAALRYLSPLQRRCLALWLEGHKYREIAEMVGVSLQTVRATISKARKRVHDLLQPLVPRAPEDPDVRP